MDLYDLGNYFASYVPIKALKSPLLLYSAAAIAAKQLGRVKGNKAIVGGPCTRPAFTEVYPNCDQTNWFYIAAKYYEKAIAFLRDELANLRSPSSNRSSLVDPCESTSKQLAQEQSHTAQADDLLAATSILSVYEFMDDSNIEWSRSVQYVICCDGSGF
jgi:hypothetical protein